MLRSIFISPPKAFMSNETIFSEVDEELRRDRARKLWRRAGPVIIGAAVGVVLLVAGFEGWRWWTQSNAAASSDAFYAALQVADGDDVDAARAALDKVAAEGVGLYPTLAKYRAAALMAQQGDLAGAAAAYDVLASGDTTGHLRDFALVMAGSLLVDGGDAAGVEQRVGAVAASTSPMRNAARETLGLAQYKAGQLDAAMNSFQSIMDDPASSTDLRTRVQIYIAQLIAEGAKAPAAEAAEGEVADEAGVDAGTELDVAPPASAEAESSSVAP
jgi:hypothetical protein